MFWRDLILQHRGQKLFALGLAILIWFTVRSTEGLHIVDDASDGRQNFGPVDIVVLTSAADLGRYTVKPAKVRVELKGDPDVLRQISPGMLEAYVNLVELGVTPQLLPIHVNPPAGTTVLSVEPLRVQVDRMAETNFPPSP